MSEEKANKLRAALDDMIGKGMVNAKVARSTAGLASWAASVVPRARPFVSHMFGAISDSRAAEEPVRDSTRR